MDSIADEVAILVMKSIREAKAICPSIFYRNVAFCPVVPPTGCFSMNDVYTEEGICVATSYDSAKLLLKCPGRKQNAFFIGQADWYKSGLPFEELESIFSSPHMTFLARDLLTQKLLKSQWGVNSHIIGDLDIHRILGVFVDT